MPSETELNNLTKEILKERALRKLKRVVAYCRVSTDHEDQKNSLENQRLYFEEYVKQHKDWVLIEVYADEGISGTSLKKRKDFNRMYRDGFQNKYDIILTKEVCRFARNTVDTLEKTRELKRIGIEVRFIIDNISTFDNDGELRLTIMAGMAQDESRRISERVQFGVIQSMKKGVAFGNIIYGYDFKEGQLYVNQEEAKIVKMIFHWYLVEGWGAYTIANELKKMGVPIKRPRNKTHSTDWRNRTVLDMLKNVKYVGDLKQRITYTVDFLEHRKKFNNGEVEFIYIRAHHEPIIDRETFEKTQQELERRSKLYSMDKSKYSCRHTFSGKLICAECGGKYVGGVSRKRENGTERRSWRCSTAVNYGKKHIVDSKEIGCNNQRVNDEVLKQSFSIILKDIIKDKVQIRDNLEKVLKNVIEKCRNEVDDVDYLIKEKEKIEKEKSKLLDLCLREIIDDNDFKDKSFELNERLNKIENELMIQQEKRVVKDNIDEIINNIRQVINNILNLKKFSKNICKELVDKVVIHSKKKFDFYLKGFCDPFKINYESDILYSQHWW